MTDEKIKAALTDALARSEAKLAYAQFEVEAAKQTINKTQELLNELFPDEKK